MASVNKVILIGNLGADPEMRTTSTGKVTAELRLATQGYTKDAPPEWHRVILWEKTAEIAGQYLHKGDPAYIEGRIQTRSYDDKEGNKRYVTEIVADRLQLLGSKRDAEAAEEPAPKTRKATTAKARKAEPETDLDQDNDLPF